MANYENLENIHIYLFHEFQPQLCLLICILMFKFGAQNDHKTATKFATIFEKIEI
jgi:hypothetical protein